MMTSGFLVLKRFEALYREFAEKPRFTCAIYALPIHNTDPQRLGVRYRGLDRDALSPSANGTLAQIRMLELNGADGDEYEDFLATYADACDVLQWADEETPGKYEIVWAQIAGNRNPPPSGFMKLGYEPGYFSGDHFSAICDCMCFPRWHGTDDAGELFRDYFDRLNAYGLFAEAATASEFLKYYLSLDWTEHVGDYTIAEVWAQA